MPKVVLSARTVTVLCALYFSTILNLGFWKYVFANLKIVDTGSVVFVGCLFLSLFLVLYAILALAAWPRFFKPFVIFLLLVAAPLNYFMVTYGIFVDKEMIRNAVQTDFRETRDLMTAGFLTWFALTALLPALLLAFVRIDYRVGIRGFLLRFVPFAACLVVLALGSAYTFKEWMVFGRNNPDFLKLANPMNVFWGGARLLKGQANVDRTFTTIDPDAFHDPYADAHYDVLIIMVGETARAQNFSLNGYERETNPELARQDIVNFRDVKAAGTSTAFSLPSIFSHKPRNDFSPERTEYTENLLDLFERSGHHVIWRENNAGCKGVCARVETETTTYADDPRYCPEGECYDEILLDGLEERLANIKQDTVIVLHMMGSHGPAYYKRYPDAYKRFLPTCDSAQIQACDVQEVVNTYDNTILYSDAVVSRAIDILKKFPNYESGLLYVSDHGESLGEGGVYLHALPYKIAPETQTKVPMVMWMSETMKQADFIDYDCLKRQGETKAYAHDNIFHSLVGLMEINSDLYDPNLDLFAACRTKPLPSQSPDY